MTDKTKSRKKPPKKAIASKQYDLFSNFVTNDESEVSNTVEYWERIPKYFFTAKQMKSLRTSDGLANPYQWHYTIKDYQGNDLPYMVKIQPALIEQDDGTYKAFFPSVTEELIEEALKKIFTEQNYGIHDPKQSESWVRFSYAMIKRELKNRGKGRSYPQIKQALEVMSKCILTVLEDGKEVYTGAILSDYCSVDRAKYLDDAKALHVARLPVFISHAINALEYRQYNYARLMECKEQLTRWLHKRLVNRYTNANFMNDYHFMYSDVKQGSGLLQQTRETDNRKKLISALNELKEQSVINHYTAQENTEGLTILDVKYTVTPTVDFVSEQKAANKRHSENIAVASKLQLVDKSR
ncbi:MAG: hypothetical protein V3V31_16160 [Methylococcales bacterium]